MARDLPPHHQYGHAKCHDYHHRVADSLVCRDWIADGVIITKEASVDRLIEEVQQQ